MEIYETPLVKNLFLDNREKSGYTIYTLLVCVNLTPKEKNRNIHKFRREK